MAKKTGRIDIYSNGGRNIITGPFAGDEKNNNLKDKRIKGFVLYILSLALTWSKHTNYPQEELNILQYSQVMEKPLREKLSRFILIKKPPLNGGFRKYLTEYLLVLCF